MSDQEEVHQGGDAPIEEEIQKEEVQEEIQQEQEQQEGDAQNVEGGEDGSLPKKSLLFNLPPPPQKPVEKGIYLFLNLSFFHFKIQNQK